MAKAIGDDDILWTLKMINIAIIISDG